MTNKKFFTVTYEVEGGQRNDTLMIWASTITEAISEFVNTEISPFGDFKIKYSEYAIKNISCK